MKHLVYTFLCKKCFQVLLTLLITTFIFQIGNAQTSQFAVVRPDGTTYICPTWDSAYSKSQDGDNIYLPGTTITSMTINKKLFIWGAGFHPDSSFATGKTIVTGQFFIIKGGSGGSIEGIQVNNGLFFDNSKKVLNYTIKRCHIQNVTFNTNGTQDSIAENTYLSESIMGNVSGYNANNCFFYKNIITSQINFFKNSSFKNNVFLIENSATSNITNSIFENNIFLFSEPVPSSSGNCGNTFLNNLKKGYPEFNESSNCPINLSQGNMSFITATDIFVKYTTTSFTFTNDYHLKPSATGVSAGTDGTDVGIYGTSQPTSAGWVPSNPHIYFKQIAPQTNSNGQLQIQVKVRTNN